MAPKREDIFYYCQWAGNFEIGCRDSVSEILTSEGLCYNVNSLAADEILRMEKYVSLRIYLGKIYQVHNKIL